jgi:hypothetical protein
MDCKTESIVSSINKNLPWLSTPAGLSFIGTSAITDTVNLESAV